MPIERTAARSPRHDPHRQPRKPAQRVVVSPHRLPRRSRSTAACVPAPPGPLRPPASPAPRRRSRGCRCRSRHGRHCGGRIVVVRPVPSPRIAVCRAQEHQHLAALQDRFFTDRHIPRRGAEERLHRAFQPHRLLERRPRQRRIGSQLRECRRITQPRQKTAAPSPLTVVSTPAVSSERTRISASATEISPYPPLHGSPRQTRSPTRPAASTAPAPTPAPARHPPGPPRRTHSEGRNC